MINLPAVEGLLRSSAVTHARDRWADGRMSRWGARAKVRGLVLRSRVTRCGYDLRVGSGFRLVRSVGSTVRLGNSVRLLDGVSFSLDALGAEISIGDQTYLNDGTHLHCRSSITIGARCRVSWGVRILDSNYHQLDDGAVDGPVVIGDDVWVGSGAQILQGITIGSGAVVAAGSVVTRDVGARTLVAGNPARVIRTEVSWTP